MNRHLQRVFCVSLVSLCPVLLTHAAGSGSVTLRSVSGSVFVCEDTFYAKENSVVYVGPRYVTVVGATWTQETAKLLAEGIRGVTDLPIREVIDTNYHPDRAGGNAYWRSLGCEIHATRQTYELLIKDWAKVCKWTHDAIPDYPLAPVSLPTDIHDGEFCLQDGHIRAIYLGPSHTPDGILVYFPAERVLYGGCMLQEQLGNLTFANLEEYPKTLRKLQALHLEILTIIAGHGSPLHGQELISHYLGLLSSVSPNQLPEAPPGQRAPVEPGSSSGAPQR